MNGKKKGRVSFENVRKKTNEMINSQEFLNSARKTPQDFTRNRKMPFKLLVLFMLSMAKTSIQKCLDSFFLDLNKLDTHMSQQAFSDARQKIKWEAFRDLFKAIVDLIYSGSYSTWHGYRVSAIDGSKMQIPDDHILRVTFGTMGKDNSAATAQASALYDVFNNVLIDVQIEPLDIGERKLAERHIKELCKLASFNKECVVFDRGYPSFELIQFLKKHNIHFVMRVKVGFNSSIDQLGKGDHTIRLQKKGHEDIKVRVIKFFLPSGDEETLITDIWDKRMGIKAFKELYFRRWPIETKFDEIKNKLEVENFSGLTEEAIRQDFFITMYMSNVAAVACWDAQMDVDEERELKNNKYRYHVNVNHAIGTLKELFLKVMLEDNPNTRRMWIRYFLWLLKKCVVPTRPGRSSPRNKSPRKAKFRHNRKSTC